MVKIQNPLHIAPKRAILQRNDARSIMEARMALEQRNLDLLTLRRRRILEAEIAKDKEHVIHLFMFNAKKLQKGVINPERLYPLAAELFGYKPGLNEIGEYELDLGQADYAKELTLAILHYMVLARKIRLSRRQFYWRDYPFEAKRKTRSIENKIEDAKKTGEIDDDSSGGQGALQLGSLVKLQQTENKDD